MKKILSFALSCLIILGCLALMSASLLGTTKMVTKLDDKFDWGLFDDDLPETSPSVVVPSFDIYGSYLVESVYGYVDESSRGRIGFVISGLDAGDYDLTWSIDESGICAFAEAYFIMSSDNDMSCINVNNAYQTDYDFGEEWKMSEPEICSGDVTVTVKNKGDKVAVFLLEVGSLDSWPIDAQQIANNYLDYLYRNITITPVE